MSKYLYVLIFLLLAITVRAQEKPLRYTWEAKLPVVDSSGFYTISPSPELLSAMNYPALSNFRIMNDSATVPYLARKQQLVYDSTSFVPLEITSSTKVGKHTVLIIHNSDSIKLDQLIILYKNTKVSKRLTIDGSDDRQHWYAVDAAYLLDPGAGLPTTDPTVSAIGKSLPVLSYRWLSVTMDDSASSPVLIKSIGYYRQRQLTPTGYTRLEVNGFQQHNNAKAHCTEVTMHLPIKALIGKLSLDIRTPGLYRRQVLVQEEIHGDEKDVPKKMRTLGTFYISSDKPAAFVLDEPVLVQDLFFQILNEDNPPLEVAGVKLWQPNISLTVYLEKNRSYYIKGAPDGIPPGKYDLDYFSKDIPRDLPVINNLKFSVLPVPAAVAVIEKPSFFSSSWWIWSGMAGIIVLLAFVANGVIKDMNKRRLE